jgi:hypothetical protein
MYRAQTTALDTNPANNKELTYGLLSARRIFQECGQSSSVREQFRDIPSQFFALQLQLITRRIEEMKCCREEDLRLWVAVVGGHLFVAMVN